MRTVSYFEQQLLRLLQGLLHRAPPEQTLQVVSKPVQRPKCLSRDAVELVQDTLAKGCVQFLARRGWMRQRFLREGKIAEGRLWQRTSPAELGLAFSLHSLEFLMQLVSATLGSRLPKSSEITLGDRLLFLLAFDALRGTPAGDEMQKQWLPLFEDGLCRLAFPDELAEGEQRSRIDWLCWTTAPGAAILETLQSWLADRTTAVELKKGKLSTVARVRQLGRTQECVYGEYLEVLGSVQRWDLARWILEAARQLLQDRPKADRWIRHLDVRNERMADRMEIYAEALSFLRQLNRLHDWSRQAHTIGYFDEGYQASQLWKADWEKYHGDELCETARAILHEVEPIK
jgi:hypothetical protein